MFFPEAFPSGMSLVGFTAKYLSEQFNIPERIIRRKLRQAERGGKVQSVFAHRGTLLRVYYSRNKPTADAWLTLIQADDATPPLNDGAGSPHTAEPKSPSPN